MPPVVNGTIDENIRRKSIELICKALQGPDSRSQGPDPHLTQLSSIIESRLHTLHPTADVYKPSVRTHVQNLKNPTSTLREMVVTGQISPERFAEMGTREMESPKRREENERLLKEAVLESRGIDGYDKPGNEEIGRYSKVWNGMDQDAIEERL